MEALDLQDKEMLLKHLQAPQLNLRDVRPDNITFYMLKLLEMRDYKKVTTCSVCTFLTLNNHAKKTRLYLDLGSYKKVNTMHNLSGYSIMLKD